MGAVNYGAMIIASSAIIGTAVSIYNYLDPMSGIAGTPGAILVIVSTLDPVRGRSDPCVRSEARRPGFASSS